MLAWDGDQGETVASLFPVAAVTGWLGFENQLSSGTDEFARDLDWLRHEIQDFVIHRASISAGQKKHSRVAARIPHHECGGRSTADAACGAIAMNLAIARIHHAEVALAVDDFSSQSYCAEAHPRGWRIGRVLWRGIANRLGKRFDHAIGRAFNQRSP